MSGRRSSGETRSSERDKKFSVLRAKVEVMPARKANTRLTVARARSIEA